MTNIIRSEMRGPGLISVAAVRLYLKATPNQPLVLRREPTNPVDFYAVVCCDMAGRPMGYVAKEDASRIAPQMDRGYMWRGKVTDPCQHDRKSIKVHARILLWLEEPSSRTKIFGLVKRPEKV